MKKMTVLITALIALSAPLAVLAMDHESMPMDHGSGMMAMGKPAHEEVVDGVKTTFRVIDIKVMMKKMGMKETHHIMVVFNNAKSGSMLSEGEVKLKVQGPNKLVQVKDLMGMEGGFGADFTLTERGKYGVMAKFKLKDGKVRSVKFWYTVE